MVRRLLVATALLAAIGCSKTSGKKGPFVARGNGIAITSEELKARLDEQSPMIRGSFQTLERKKQSLDNLLRFELLAKAAEKEGLANDPDVQFTMKKVMVSKYYQKHFQDQKGAESVPEPELRKYYDEHQKDEFHRPARVHAVDLFVKAEAGSPQRAQKLADAKKLLAKVQAEEKKDPNALSRIARESSDDLAAKAMGGDLGFKTVEDYEKAQGKEFANAVFKLGDNQTSSDVIETAQGFHIARVLGRQPELNRPFDEVKGQIAAKLNGQRRTREFDDLLKKLREDAKVQIYDAELEKVQVAAPSSPAGGPHGMMGGVMGGGATPGGPARPTAAAPARPAAPAAPAAPAGH
jgi:peptidyl-prolyl cis-trans isomerase C